MQIRSSRESSDRRKSDTSRLRSRTKVFLLGVAIGALGGQRVLELLTHYGLW